MLPVVVVSSGASPLVEGISSRIPWFPPPVRQSLHGRSHLQCREIGISPGDGSRPRKSSYVIRVFWFNAIFSVVSTDTDNKIRFKMFTYSCQQWVLLHLSKQYIISTYTSTHLTFIKSFRGIPSFMTLYIYTQ